MARMVKCVKLGIEAEGLEYQTHPGELGERVFAEVSKQAWGEWLQHQTMLINEYRLTPFQAEARRYLEEQMEEYFFGTGETKKPDGFVAPAE